MIIHSYETGRRSEACRDRLRCSSALKYIKEVYLLPIPTTKDNKTILGTNIDISEVFKLADEFSLVVGYGIPKHLYNEESLPCPVYDLLYDEEFLTENARLTAEAALGIILTSTDRSIADMAVGIVGYGRIGKALARLLLCLGANVKIFTSTRSTRLDLCECGVSAAESGIDADLSGIDILVNTAPAVLFEENGVCRVPRGLRVMELASGNNFPSLSSVERYPSIPAKMYPVSAGNLWAESIEKFMRGYNSL